MHSQQHRKIKAMPNKPKSELWQRIRAARMHAKMTQLQVAEALGISSSAVTQWEAKLPERRTTPDTNHLKRIAALFHAPIEWLLSDDSEIGDDWYEKIGEDNVVPFSANQIQHPKFLVQLQEVEVTDNRMAPLISAGDTVTINPSLREPIHGKIYAIGARNTLARVSVSLSGEISAGFDSDKSTTYPLDPDDIVGQAVRRSGPL
jgi:transcriptional regulator with XRE-family HTH domain